MIGALILQVVLIFLNAVFASAEIAVISMGDVKLEKMSKEGNKKAKRLLNLTSDPARFLSTIQVAITLSGFLGSAYAADNFAGTLVNLVLETGIDIPESVLRSIFVFLITLLLAYFSIVFGELVPKRIAMHNTEAMALGLSGILTVVAKIFKPLVWLLTVSANGILKLLGISPQEEEEVTEEDILMMVAAGNEKGTIEEGENEIVQNVFEMNDTSVEEICTHRVDVVLLEMDDSLEKWDSCIYETRHNYYPICGDDSDDIVGVLDAKDYLRMKDRTKEKVLEGAIRKPYFVLETMKADVLFGKMRKSGNYFAIVVDEYGGMRGIVTMRDLLELLVGDLYEQEDEQIPEITKQKDDTWVIQGSAPLDEVAEELGVELPVDDYDTFSGYICGVLGEVPDDGVRFEVETPALKIQVSDVQERRIKEATVVRKEIRQEPENQEEEE